MLFTSAKIWYYLNPFGDFSKCTGGETPWSLMYCFLLHIPVRASQMPCCRRWSYVLEFASVGAPVAHLVSPPAAAVVHRPSTWRQRRGVLATARHGNSFVLEITRVLSKNYIEAKSCRYFQNANWTGNVIISANGCIWYRFHINIQCESDNQYV